MAGIGFRLRRIFEKDTYTDTLRGMIMSAAIAGGPIFFSILCLILLGIFATPFITGKNMHLFLVTLVYIFAFSLITTGVTQLVITRYLSDQLYLNKKENILPSVTAVLIVTVVCQLAVGTPFMFLWDISFTYKYGALILFVVLGCIWQLLIFISAVRNYKIIFIAFALGLVMSFALAMVFGKTFGLPGFIHGYAVGQIVLMYVLLARVFVEFKSGVKPNFSFFRQFKEMPQLIFIGLFYNIGIWIDKIIFWFSPVGQHVDSFLYAYTDYDGATFFAFLTAIPSYTYFLVKIETDFYGYFRAFFHSIINKRPYSDIHAEKLKIAATVRESLTGLIKLQGTVTLLCLLFVEQIAGFFNLPALGTMILEKALIAVFLQMLLLTVLIFLMYFDIRLEVLIVTTVFFVSNVLFTLITLKLGYVFYGYGYLFACLLGLVVGYVFLDRHLRDLEYRTFVSQPLSP